MNKIPVTDISKKIYYHFIIPLLGKMPVTRVLKLFRNFNEWQKEYSGTYPVYSSRKEMYAAIFDTFSDRKINLFEFGVFEGESLAEFIKLNVHEESRFYGFDTFTGLPETWNDLAKTVPAGFFNTNGKLPSITDTRVKFIEGKFQDTLPDFLNNFHPEGDLVIHIDSDLYSSAKFVLEKCNPLFNKKCIIIFDEFYSLAHEFLALYEFTQLNHKKYRVICGTKNYVQIAIIFDKKTTG